MSLHKYCTIHSCVKLIVFSFYTATEDPICMPVLEVEKEPQVSDKRVRPVGRHEGFSTLHSIAGRERVSVHTRTAHMHSKEGAVCVCVCACVHNSGTIYLLSAHSAPLQLFTK